MAHITFNPNQPIQSLSGTIKAPTKLQRTILSEYYARFSATSTGQYRCKIGPTSDQSRGKNKNQHNINRLHESND